MAITIDWGTGVISVPQSDLTLVSGTLYAMDTEVFRLALKALEDNAEGMPFLKTHNRNAPVTVGGITYAQTFEVLPPYSVQFTPDSPWSVRLEGSNNNIWDVEAGILVQNQVQVIPTNSAGLIVAGSGLTGTQDTTLTAISDQLLAIEGSFDHKQLMRLVAASLAGDLSGAGTTTVEIDGVGGAKLRIRATVDEVGNRTVTLVDASA